MSLQEKYKSVFETPDGLDVLSDIMERGKIFSPVLNDNDMGRTNLAKEIMLLALSDKEGQAEGKNYSLLDGRRFKEIIKRIRKKK